MMIANLESKFNVGDKVYLRGSCDRWKAKVIGVTFNVDTKEFTYDVMLIIKNKNYSGITNCHENMLDAR